MQEAQQGARGVLIRQDGSLAMRGAGLAEAPRPEPLEPGNITTTRRQCEWLTRGCQMMKQTLVVSLKSLIQEKTVHDGGSASSGALFQRHFGGPNM